MHAADFDPRSEHLKLTQGMDLFFGAFFLYSLRTLGTLGIRYVGCICSIYFQQNAYVYSKHRKMQRNAGKKTPNSLASGTFKQNVREKSQTRSSLTLFVSRQILKDDSNLNVLDVRFCSHTLFAFYLRHIFLKIRGHLFTFREICKRRQT